MLSIQKGVNPGGRTTSTKILINEEMAETVPKDIDIKGGLTVYEEHFMPTNNNF